MSDASHTTPGAAGESGLIEAVARAIFEADEDINDAQEARLRASGSTTAADCLAGPRARWDDPKNAPILDAFRQRARAAVEAMLTPVLATSYGPPSMWPGEYPKGWRHPPAWPSDQRPTPEEACWHDNGVRDVWFALRAALATGGAREDVKCRCVSTFGPNPECGACGGSGCVSTESSHA